MFSVYEVDHSDITSDEISTDNRLYLMENTEKNYKSPF